jgi:hypothetical protein
MQVLGSHAGLRHKEGADVRAFLFRAREHFHRAAAPSVPQRRLSRASWG